MLDIYIVRHGETENNKKRVLQGRSNLPLNEAGAEQAETVRDYFADQDIQFDKVYSSPLIRAVQTAQIVIGEEPTGTEKASDRSAERNHSIDPDSSADAVMFVLDDLLLEMDYGPYEGCSLLDPPPEIIEFFSDFVNNPAPAGMESLSDLVARMGKFTERLIDESNRIGESSRIGENNQGDEQHQAILVSTHAIAMKGILEYLTPESHGSYWNKFIANCAVFKTTLKDGKYTVPVEVL